MDPVTIDDVVEYFSTEDKPVSEKTIRRWIKNAEIFEVKNGKIHQKIPEKFKKGQGQIGDKLEGQIGRKNPFCPSQKRDKLENVRMSLKPNRDKGQIGKCP